MKLTQEKVAHSLRFSCHLVILAPAWQGRRCGGTSLVAYLGFSVPDLSQTVLNPKLPTGHGELG